MLYWLHMADDVRTSVAASANGSNRPCCPCSRFSAKCIRSTCSCKRRGFSCSSCGPLSLGRCCNRLPDNNGVTKVPSQGDNILRPSSDQPSKETGSEDACRSWPIAIGVDCAQFADRPRKKSSTDDPNTARLVGHDRAGLVACPDAQNVQDEQNDSHLTLSADGPFDIDAKLEEIYGDKILNGPGCDRTDCWYRWWEKTVRLPFRRYDLPGGNVGRKFVDALAREVGLVAAQKEFSERLVVFQFVIVQREPLVRKASDICRVVSKRLELWETDSFDTLVAEAVRCSESLGKRSGCNTSRQEHDHSARVFHRLLIQGKLR